MLKRDEERNFIVAPEIVYIVSVLLFVMFFFNLTLYMKCKKLQDVNKAIRENCIIDVEVEPAEIPKELEKEISYKTSKKRGRL